ncbi:MAG: hypothetical protein KF735_10825 [Chelatococcus sp.]|uniref:hypothetical protein n=1 Tax=Chelatococcus sp. TaxID=1953771 RepID=UPI0025B9840B|nr:hypothetical protein [Chelatococcus sp.]MBX3538125.1 hypothetical protein [Chelatococcus sp.]
MWSTAMKAPPARLPMKDMEKHNCGEVPNLQAAITWLSTLCHHHGVKTPSIHPISHIDLNETNLKSIDAESFYTVGAARVTLLNNSRKQ